ncbi:hypothetical protein ABID56_002409 [Alkalibacillus flavidus]|uniref:Type II secretion system protein n=1 Tax=Alkalibacillus flavidus TaxID=546021 RepID=A0ABV2KXI4_9BACI
MLLKNNNGFILTDALLALSCLMVITTILLPFLIQLHARQSDIEKQHDAYLLMQSQLEERLPITEDKLIDTTYNDHHYTINLSPKDHQTLICIEWMTFNNETDRYCHYTKSVNEH